MVKKKEDLAFQLSKIGVEKKNPLAYRNLGIMYEDGTGGAKKDVAEAVRLYKEGTDLGSPYAQNCLGYCYEQGVGITQDNKEADRLYTLSAEQGYDKAQYNMGVNYKYGKIGLTKNNDVAKRWFQLAAAQGDEDSAREAASL